MRNESTTVLVTSCVKSTVKNCDSNIDKGIVLRNDEVNDHDSNVDAVIDKNSLEDLSHIFASSSDRAAISKSIATNAYFMFLFVLLRMFSLIFFISNSVPANAMISAIDTSTILSPSLTLFLTAFVLLQLRTLTFLNKILLALVITL